MKQFLMSSFSAKRYFVKPILRSFFPLSPSSNSTGNYQIWLTLKVKKFTFSISCLVVMVDLQEIALVLRTLFALPLKKRFLSKGYYSKTNHLPYIQNCMFYFIALNYHCIVSSSSRLVSYKIMKLISIKTATEGDRTNCSKL